MVFVALTAGKPDWSGRAFLAPRAARGDAGPVVMGRAPFPGQLTRPRYPRMIAGVCSGLALHYGWDLSVVRVICALMIVLTGVGLFAYLAAWIIIPEAPYALPQNGPAGNAGAGV